ANLPIVRACVRHGKGLVFPSTSEVYGMSPGRDFDPDASPLVYGPIHRHRWIDACSKQLMDRVIWAYGQQEGLDFTLFRPFNWMVDLALEYPEYRDAARKVKIVRTSAERYYGRGYQDMQNRVPNIAATKRDLGWRPRVGMKDALRHIYDAYRTHVAEARHLVK